MRNGVMIHLNDPKKRGKRSTAFVHLPKLKVEVCPQPPSSGAVPSLSFRNFLSPVLNSDCL